MIERQRAQRLAWPAVSMLATLAVAVLAFADLELWLRAPLGLFFLLLCPGMAIVRVLETRDPVADLTLAVALSIALDVIVAGALLYAGAWSPNAALGILMAITVGGVLLELLVGRARRGDPA
ncbi:MAG: hypothetical protein H0T39_04430 [Actinobacteria bacterium]|nr:hypothetical protein [Actinomycetota bacterium]